MSHRDYRVRTGFQTANSLSQERTKTLLGLLDRYFRRGLESVNLETGAIINPSLADDLREEWVDKLRSNWEAYLFVGMVSGNTGDEPKIFWGARPNGGM